MAKIAKYLAITVACLLLLVLAVLAYILLLVNPNDYKPEIARLVKDKTDMTLDMSGQLDWQLWPRLALRVGKTELRDDQARQTLLAIGQASASVQIMPLLGGKVAIDEVTLDKAQLDFIRHADGSTSWDRLLAKLKSAPEEKSDKVDLQVQVFSLTQGGLHFRDEQAKLDGHLQNLRVMASGIDLNKAFPVSLKFTWSQQDGQGKTLRADNDLQATVRLQQEAQHYWLDGLQLATALSGTLLPAPLQLTLKGAVDADVKQQLHKVDGLLLTADYHDPALSAPAHVELSGKLQADLQQQLVRMEGIKLAASYPQKGLKAPATVQLALNGSADLKQQLINLATITAHAVYPDASRPAPLTADLSGALNAHLDTGELAFAPLDLRASLSDAAFAKPLPVHLLAPVTANWKEGRVALNGFSLDALDVQTRGQLQVLLPALAGKAAAGAPVTAGMELSGNIATSPFNLRQLLQAVGMKLPPMRDANTLQRVSMSTQVSGTGNSVLLKGLSLKLDDSSLSGDAGLADLQAGKLYARLNLDRLDADRYLPPTAAQPAKTAAKPSTADLLPVDLLRSQKIDAALTAGSLTIMGYPIQKLQVAINADGGLLTVKQLAGTVLSGSFSLPATVDVRGKTPQVSVQANVQQIEIANLVQKFTGKDLLAGKAGYQGSLKMSGNSVQAWTSSLAGDSTLRFDNGTLKGVNMMQLVLTEMGKYQAFLPALTGKDAATIASKQNDTEIASFLGEATITGGNVQTRSLNANLRKATLGGSGSFNLATLDVDYSVKLQLDKSVVGESVAKYPFPIRCKGNLATPASLCSVDSRAVRELATSALLQSEQAQKLKTQLEQKQAEAQAKVQQKYDAETQRAAEKVNEKLNEQLQRLFRH